jgi:hypothetical protein
MRCDRVAGGAETPAADRGPGSTASRPWRVAFVFADLPAAAEEALARHLFLVQRELRRRELGLPGRS